MKWIWALACLGLLFGVIESKPVNAPKSGKAPEAVEGGSEEEKTDTNLPYDHYLREVVQVLEEDPEFRKKLESANVSEIKDGSVAGHLDLVSHSIRTKLDEIKRKEVHRLEELYRLQMKSMNGTQVLHYIAYHGGVKNLEIPRHLDVINPHSFEIKDLETLIKQTTHDLEKLDEQRKEEFKEYEMEKDYERKERLKQLSEEQRKKEELHYEEMKKKHAEHPKIHHPGSKDQLEEVWEKTDHLEDQDFNPKTFFRMHDTQGDGYWGIEEVEAVLQRELDKVYDGRNEEDDPIERFEEMNRMREHIFSTVDTDKDARISMKEFLEYTGPDGQKDEFKKDDGWKTVDEEQVYTDEEFQKFAEQHHAQPGVIGIPGDPNVQQMHIPQGQMGQGQGQPPAQGQPLQYQPQGDHNFQQQQQQQQQYAQQQQVLQHQQQQFSQQQAAQAQLAQQHAQIQQQAQQQAQQQMNQQQQAQQQMNQAPLQGQQGQVPVQQQQQHPPQQQQQQQHPPQQQQQQQHLPPQQQQHQQPPQQQQQQQQQHLPPQQQQHQQPPQQQQHLPPQQQQQQHLPPQQQQHLPPQQQQHLPPQQQQQQQQQHGQQQGQV